MHLAEEWQHLKSSVKVRWLLAIAVVRQCETNGTVTRLRVTNEGVAPIYRDAWFAIGNTRSATSLRGLLPGDEFMVEIPAVPRTDGTDVHIVSDHILPQQQIEFEAK